MILRAPSLKRKAIKNEALKSNAQYSMFNIQCSIKMHLCFVLRIEH